MIVTFHVLTAAGIAHIAATRLKSSPDIWLHRSDAPVLAPAIALGVMSHGILDGLKHGYPIPTMPDIFFAGALAACWCLCVRRRFFLLFAAVSLASLAPDIVDHGPKMLRAATGIAIPVFDVALFPWHWPDGSGSMFPMSSKAPDAMRILDMGQNGIVSWINHLIVVAFAVSAIAVNPRVFRFLPLRDSQLPCT